MATIEEYKRMLGGSQAANNRLKQQIKELEKLVCPCLGQGGYEHCRAFAHADELTRKLASDQMVELSVESAKLTQKLWQEDLDWFDKAQSLIADMWSGGAFDAGACYSDRIDEFWQRTKELGIEVNYE